MSEVHMVTIPAILNIDEQCLVVTLDRASKQLDGSPDEIVLDFSSVRRIDAASLRRLEEFAAAAKAGNVKVVLRGVNVNLYKTLKLMKLTRELSFVN
jgi:anti-anti-sigma regulatory factor